MKPGQSAIVDFPGHPWHGKRVRVDSVQPAFNLAHDGDEPILGPVIFVQRKRTDEPVGFPLERLQGTAENAQLRIEERPDAGDRQGGLLL
jgi:hypothetical protein